MAEIKTISCDVETYSSVDLAKCGVYKYAESPDFEILLFGYAVDGGEVNVVDLKAGETIPDDILDALTDDRVAKWAFNAQFERVCLSRYLSDLGVSLDPFHDRHPLSTECARFLNPEGWRCSMVWAATLGLPLSLEGVGAVLGLEKQKLTEGKELIRFFCVPCRETKSNGGRTRNLPEHEPEKWARFKAYNARDVETEMGIQQKLINFPVSADIWEEYRIDQEINDRGIGIDMELVRQAIRMDEQAREKLTAAMKKLTELDNPNSVVQMKQWLSENGMEVDSLGKKEVSAMLKDCPEELRPRSGTPAAARQVVGKKVHSHAERRLCGQPRERNVPVLRSQSDRAFCRENHPTAKSSAEPSAGSGGSPCPCPIRRLCSSRDDL